MNTHDRVATLASGFADWTGRPAEGVWRSPGRINLIGEHLDYNGGHVLPLAIGLSTWLAVRRTGAGLLRLRSTAFPGPVEVPLGELARTTGWASYPAGVMWALADYIEPFGADVLIDSDLPPGAGLSSSAALECAMALAVADLGQVDPGRGSGPGLGPGPGPGPGPGLPVDRMRLALAAQRAESAVAGAPVGIMDQTTSLLARAGHALHLDTATLAVEHLPLRLGDAGLCLLAVDTGHAHELNDGAYSARRRECEAAAAAIGVEWLARAGVDQLESAGLGAELSRRARHVVTEEQRVENVAVDLRAGRLDRLGPAMTASHRSMQLDFENSTPTMDAVVDAAIAAGAAGARMTGGGWGGTAIILVSLEDAEAVGRAAAGVVLAHTGRRPAVLRVEPSVGGERVL